MALELDVGFVAGTAPIRAALVVAGTHTAATHLHAAFPWDLVAAAQMRGAVLLGSEDECFDAEEEVARTEAVIVILLTQRRVREASPDGLVSVGLGQGDSRWAGPLQGDPALGGSRHHLDDDV